MEWKFITEFTIKYEEIYLRKETTHNYFYKITNLINEKFYYGIHSTNNLDDGYMGSGRKIIKAIEKYGVENFKKEIIADYSTRKEVSDHEKLIVTREIVNLDECYNMVLGGIDKDCSGENNPFYGKQHTEETKIILSENNKGEKNGFFGRKHSEETRKRLSESMRGKFIGENSPRYKCSVSEETRKKISIANFGKKRDDEYKRKKSERMSGENNPFYGKQHTEETKEKIREKRKLQVITIETKEKISKNNKSSKKCSVDEIVFNSMKSASKYFEISRKTAVYRFKSDNEKWCNWKILE